MSQLDIKELLKREAFAGTNAGSAAGDGHFEKSRPAPDEPWGFSDQYVILDSWAKDLASSNPAAGRFAWNFNVQGATTDQAVGVKDVVDTVTEIQLGSFTIPLIYPNLQMQNPLPGGTPISGFPLLDLGTDNSDPTDPLSATFGWLSPYVGRVTVELVEIGLQAVSQRRGVRYHFEADVIAVYLTQGTNDAALGTPVSAPGNPFPNALRVVPLPSFDTYAFTDPIQDVHGLTLQFRAVDTPLPFPADEIRGAVPYTSPAIYPSLGFMLPVAAADWATLQGFITTAVGLGRMQVSGLATGDAAIDNWVNLAPSVVGQLQALAPGAAPAIGIGTTDVSALTPGQVAVVVPTPYVDVTPLVPAAPAAVTAIPSAATVTVRFCAARVRIPLRLRRVVSRTTNYA